MRAVLLLALVVLAFAPSAQAGGLEFDGPRFVDPWASVPLEATVLPVQGLPNLLNNGLMNASVDGWRLVQDETRSGAAVRYEAQPDGSMAARVDVRNAGRPGSLWLLDVVSLEKLGERPLEFQVEYRTSGNVRVVAPVLREFFPPEAARDAIDLELVASPSIEWRPLGTTWNRGAPDSHALGVHLRFVVDANASGTVWFRNASLLPPLEYSWSVNGEAVPEASGASAMLRLPPGLHLLQANASSPLGGTVSGRHEVLVGEAILSFCVGGDGRLHVQGNSTGLPLDAMIVARDDAKNAKDSPVGSINLSTLGHGFELVAQQHDGIFTAIVDVGGASVKVASAKHVASKSTFVRSVELLPDSSRYAEGTLVRVEACDPGLNALAAILQVRDREVRVPLEHTAPGVWEAVFHPQWWDPAGSAKVRVEGTLSDGTAVSLPVAKASVRIGPTDAAQNLATGGLLGASFVVALGWTLWEQRRRL